MAYRTIEQLESLVGEKLRAYRLDRNQSREHIAEKAGISLGTLRNLETGNGGTIRSLIRVLKAFQLEDWLDTMAPISAVNPLLMVNEQPRQRARRSAKNGS